MKPKKVKVKELVEMDLGPKILIGDIWMKYAGAAQEEPEFYIINFFLEGRHEGILGKLYLPKNFPIWIKPNA